MNTKITFILVFTILSIQLKAQQSGGANGTADLDIPNFVRVYTIDAIGGEQVETYKNNSKQYFYNPLLLVDWGDFKQQLDTYNGQNENILIKKLLLKIYHYDQKVYDELKMLLERDENIQNINLSFLPYSYYIIQARIGDDYIVINQTDLPTFSKVESGSYQPVHITRNVRNYEISGSLRQLKEFYRLRSSNDNLKGSLYMGGFQFSSDYVKGTADFATSSTIKKKLFGDETLIDNQVVKSSSGGGGLSLSLGPLKLGGGKVDSKVWTENEKKRILNRNYVSDLITDNRTEIHVISMGDADKVRETKNEIMKYLLEKVASQVTLEFQKVSDNEYNLVKDNITYSTLKNDQVDKLLKSKPQQEFTSATEQSGSYGGASGSNKDNITSKGGDDITWQYKGNEWIPTKVDMYILSELQLKNSLSIDALSYNKEGKKTIEIPFIFPAAWLDGNSQILNSGVVDRDNPVGTVLAFAGNIDKIPAGWKLCNGDTLPIHGNEEIFNIVGYNWGKGNNSDFKLPDFRGVFLRGVSLNSGNDPDVEARGVNGNGEKNSVGSSQSDAFGKHSHPVHIAASQPGGSNINESLSLDDDGGIHLTVKNKATATEVGGNETRPKNKYVNYIIRCK
ncbi:MAG: phage tail protein [Agriterribacter sp.]